MSFWSYVLLGGMLVLSGMVDAISGGGGLISISAYLMAGLSPHVAIATNKLGALAGSITSNYRFIRNRMVDFSFVLPCIIVSVVGSLIGTNISMNTDEATLMTVMIIILPIAAFLVLDDKLFNDRGSSEIQKDRRTILTAMLCSFIVSIYDGFYGPGVGTFYLLAFTIFLKLKVKVAKAQVKFIGLFSTAVSFVTFLMNGQVAIGIGIYAIICNMIGSYIGAGMVMKNGMKVAKPSIILVLVLLAVKFVTDQF